MLLDGILDFLAGSDMIITASSGGYITCLGHEYLAPICRAAERGDRRGNLPQGHKV